MTRKILLALLSCAVALPLAAQDYAHTSGFNIFVAPQRFKRPLELDCRSLASEPLSAANRVKIGCDSTGPALKFSINGGAWTELSTGGGSGDVVGASASVDSEVALFSGIGGKTIKRATGSGIVKVTSGVFGLASAGDFPTLNQSTTANAATASALAANGSNCSAGNAPLGVDASGNAETCQALPTNTTSSAFNFFTAYNSTTGGFTKARPACADLSDVGVFCGGTDAANLSGSLAAARMPAITGDTQSSAGSTATLTKQLHLTITALTNASSPYTVLAADSFITCDATAGAITINLPAATGGGREISIKKIDSSSNACTPTRAGSDTVDGATSFSLTSQYAASKVIDSASATWLRTHVNQVGGDVSGVSTNQTVTKVNGVAYAASPATDTVPVITAANTATYKAVPDCTDSGGNHLNYTASTHAISCGTSSGSAGANAALDNLAAVQINADLQSAPATQLNLGVSNRATDAAPNVASITGGSAWSQATTNTSGANLRLASGMGRRFYTIVLNTGLSTKTVTTTVDGTAVTLTAGTNFTLGTDDTQSQRNVTATNLAAAINANGTLSAALTATASTNFVYIDKKAGIGAVNLATNAAGTVLTATMGADGAVTVRCNTNAAADICMQILPGTSSGFIKFFAGSGMTLNGDPSTMSNILTVQSGGSNVLQVVFNSINFSQPANFGGGNTIIDVNGNIGMGARDLTVRHIIGGGTSPTVGGSCGTSPSISRGKDLSYDITVGSGTPTSCTITFGTSFSATPGCQVTLGTSFPNCSTSPPTCVPTTTTATVSTAAGTLVAGEVLHVSTFQ